MHIFRYHAESLELRGRILAVISFGLRGQSLLNQLCIIISTKPKRRLTHAQILTCISFMRKNKYHCVLMTIVPTCHSARTKSLLEINLCPYYSRAIIQLCCNDCHHVYAQTARYVFSLLFHGCELFTQAGRTSDLFTRERRQLLGFVGT